MSAFADFLFQTGVQLTALQAGIDLCRSCGEHPVEAGGALCTGCLDRMPKPHVLATAGRGNYIDGRIVHCRECGAWAYYGTDMWLNEDHEPMPECEGGQR